MLALAPAFRGNTNPMVRVDCFSRERYSSYGKKLLTYVEIPAFSIENTWRGASEIIKTFKFESLSRATLNGLASLTLP
jgi:hypothetical protein